MSYARMATFGNSGNSKKLQKYTCETCVFNTSNKNDYNRHLKTIKHLGNTEETEKLKCGGCEREYMSHSGLWKHKKTCIVITPLVDQTELILNVLQQNKELNTLLIEQTKQTAEQNRMHAEKDAEQTRMNAELHAKVIELCKNGIINNSTTHNNSHNKTFNLQIFLNETCKDAVNLEDFAKAVVLQLSDLDKIGEFGFVDGMTNIIETRLKSLDVNKRPIHCTDAKREVFYVKDNDKWGKDKNNEKMRRLILRMDRKLAPLLIAFDQNYKKRGHTTDYEDIKHQQMKYEILGGADDAKNADAIIRRISKKCLIEKCDTIC